MSDYDIMVDELTATGDPYLIDVADAIKALTERNEKMEQTLRTALQTVEAALQTLDIDKP